MDLNLVSDDCHKGHAAGGEDMCAPQVRLRSGGRCRYMLRYPLENTRAQEYGRNSETKALTGNIKHNQASRDSTKEGRKSLRATVVPWAGEAFQAGETKANWHLPFAAGPARTTCLAAIVL